MGEGNHNLKQSAFFRGIMNVRDPIVPLAPAARDTVDDGSIHLYIFSFRKESSVSKASSGAPNGKFRKISVRKTI